jgi:hypothetical protein
LQKAPLYTSFGIRPKTILIAGTILLFALGTHTFVSSNVFTKEYAHALKARAFDIAQNLNSQLDRLLRLGIPLENLTGFDEPCKDLARKHADISYAEECVHTLQVV